MRNNQKFLFPALIVALAGFFTNAVVAQTVLTTETFDTLAAGSTPGGGYTFGSAVSTRQVTSLVGVGGSNALALVANFPAAGGGAAWQFQRGTLTGNTSTKASDYLFEFDAKGNEASRSVSMFFQTWTGNNFSGTQLGDGVATFTLPATANQFQHYTVNLGTSLNYSGTAKAIDPTAKTLQVNIQIDSGGWGVDTGNTLILDNIKLTMVPEPSTIALGALGVIGLFFMRRRNR